MPLRVYDETLAVLRKAVDRAKIGQDDKLAALRRLDEASRRLESSTKREGGDAFDFDRHVAQERASSRAWGGRTAGSRPAGRSRASPGEPKDGTAQTSLPLFGARAPRQDD